jgi:hypothetical protein
MLGSVGQDDESEQDTAEVGDGVLVVSGGKPAPLLEPVEGPFNGVSQLVRLGVEARRASALGSLGLAVRDLVAPLGDGVPDPALTQIGSVLGWEYALSAKSRKPRWWPPSASASSSGASIGLSPAWPAVSNASTGVQVGSDRACTLVVSPPRERPSA